MAVDGIGDVFATGINSLDEDLVIKFPANCDNSSCEELLLNTTNSVNEISADITGDLFVLENYYSTPVTLIEFPAGGGSPVSLPFIAPPQAFDGVGDIYSFVPDTTSVYAHSVNFVEIPAGSKTPIILVSNLDGYYCGPYTLAVDLAGNAYYTYGCYTYGTPTQTSTVEFQRSGFAPLDFGEVPLGGTTTRTLGVTNTGNRTLVLSPSYKSPSYKILLESPSGCESAIAPGDTCTLQVQFSALSLGAHTITLTLGSNGAADAVVLLQGVGVK